MNEPVINIDQLIVTIDSWYLVDVRLTGKLTNIW